MIAIHELTDVLAYYDSSLNGFIRFFLIHKTLLWNQAHVNQVPYPVALEINSDRQSMERFGQSRKIPVAWAL